MRQADDTSSREVEIKLLLRRQHIKRLRRHPLLSAGFREAGKAIRQETVYFDDRQRTLRKKGLSLRVRQVGDRRIQTIKALNGHGGPVNRGEWQADVGSSRPDLSAAANTPLAPVLSKLRDPLEPVFETRVARTAFPVRFGDSEIVLALDQGKIDTGSTTEPICELELELKRGRATDLFRLAQQIDGKIPLELTYATKSARGYALLDERGSEVAKSRGLQLQAGISCADAFRAIAHECLRQIMQNREGVGRGRPEALHQVRIGIRRFRTALTLFRDVVSGPGTEEVKAQLRWLRDLTGPARDLDVFVADVMAPIQSQFPKDKAVGRFLRHARQRRAKATRAARTAILSAQFRKFVVQTAGWIEAGDWRTDADALTRARQDAPVGVQAAERLSILRRKVRKHGKFLRRLDDAQRHRLRVRAKKLRYAAEFFAGLAPAKKDRKRAKELSEAVRALQDKLGALNDLAVHKSLAADIARDAAPAQTRKRDNGEGNFVAGLIAGHLEAGAGRILDEAEEAFEALRKVKPFWKAMHEVAAPAYASPEHEREGAGRTEPDEPAAAAAAAPPQEAARSTT